MSDAEAPWYAAGLRFQCARCGICCKGPQPGFVWVSEAEIAALATHLGLTVDAFGARYLRRIGARYSLVEKASHDCIFWEDGRGCTVYAARPTQCRTFPFWDEHLASPEGWAKIDWCHGKDEGRLYDPATIQQIARGQGAASGEPPATESTSQDSKRLREPPKTPNDAEGSRGLS